MSAHLANRLTRLLRAWPTPRLSVPAAGSMTTFVLDRNQGTCRAEVTSSVAGIAWVRQGPGITLLKRTENEGMDFAAHNTSITYVTEALRTIKKYRHFMFLNSSVKGPFTPKYYPFHWSQPFISRINNRVKAVSSSLVCLPAFDAGVPSRPDSCRPRPLSTCLTHSGIFQLRSPSIAAGAVPACVLHMISTQRTKHSRTYSTPQLRSSPHWGNVPLANNTCHKSHPALDYHHG